MSNTFNGRAYKVDKKRNETELDQTRVKFNSSNRRNVWHTFPLNGNTMGTCNGEDETNASSIREQYVLRLATSSCISVCNNCLWLAALCNTLFFYKTGYLFLSFPIFTFFFLFFFIVCLLLIYFPVLAEQQIRLARWVTSFFSFGLRVLIIIIFFLKCLSSLFFANFFVSPFVSKEKKKKKKNRTTCAYQTHSHCVPLKGNRFTTEKDFKREEKRGEERYDHNNNMVVLVKR